MLIAAALALLVAGVCIRLGLWQLDRLHGRRDINAAVDAGLARPARPLEDLLVDHAATSLGFRRITVAGTYDTTDDIVLYGRSLDGRNGNHVLTPLRPSGGGRIVIVDRGWVPIEMDTPPLDDAAAPVGEVTVTGVLFPPDDSGGAALSAPTVSHVDLTQIGATIGDDVLPMYVMLSVQSPAQAAGLPVPAPLPERTEGPHLSYALQWFVFAAIAIVGLFVLVRRDVRDQARDDARDPGPGVA